MTHARIGAKHASASARCASTELWSSRLPPRSAVSPARRPPRSPPSSSWPRCCSTARCGGPASSRPWSFSPAAVCGRHRASAPSSRSCSTSGRGSARRGAARGAAWWRRRRRCEPECSATSRRSCGSIARVVRSGRCARACTRGRLSSRAATAWTSSPSSPRRSCSATRTCRIRRSPPHARPSR